jgi:hypothetical protein
MDETSGHAVERLMAEGICVVSLLDESQSVLASDPVAIAAAAPFVEIDFVDWLRIEMFGEDGLDFGKRVEPGEQSRAFLAIEEALIELFADSVGEAGDFTGAHELVDG